MEMGATDYTDQDEAESDSQSVKTLNFSVSYRRKIPRDTIENAKLLLTCFFQIEDENRRRILTNTAKQFVNMEIDADSS